MKRTFLTFNSVLSKSLVFSLSLCSLHVNRETHIAKKSSYPGLQNNMQEVTNYSVSLKKSHKIEIENMNTGERLQEFTTSFSPESSMFPPNKEIIRIYFTPSNFNLMVPADKPIRQVKPVDSVKTFHIRSINFENDDFNESQQDFLINLINNAFIAGEKTTRYLTKPSQAGEVLRIIIPSHMFQGIAWMILTSTTSSTLISPRLRNTSLLK